jgi:hypothetical protein
MFQWRRVRQELAGACVCVALLSGGVAAAQTPLASVRGTVLDAAARPIVGAQVDLVHEATGERRSVETGQEGSFAFVFVAPGRQRLEVARDGFRTHVRQLTLGVGEELRAGVTLDIGPISDAVNVTAPEIDVQRDTASVGARVGARELASLPLDGRNFLDLTQLVAGVTPAAPGAAATVRGDFAAAINGARDDANGYLLDGADNVDPKLNTPAVRPPLDAIDAFEVVASTPDASFGRYGGGQLNVVVKSGSNRTGGTLSGYFRNAALDGRNVFALDGTDPEYDRKQVGGSLGGPIARNRVFYFVDYEATRTREGITRVTTVPTAAERAGDFSRSAFRAPFNPFTQQPFPGGTLPPFFLHPVGRRIAELYPLPNRPGPFGNYVSSPVLRDAVDHADAKITVQSGPSSTVTARYSVGDRRLLEPFAGPTFAAVPGFGNEVDRRAHNAVVSEARVLSSTLVNEARIAFTRVSASVVPEGRDRHLNAEVGLPDLSSNPRDFGLSFITVSGFSPLGDEFNNPQGSTTNAFQFTDTISWAAGQHLVKVGADVLAIRQDAFRDVQARGQISFTDQAYTGNALADLLLGLPSFTVGARVDNPQRLRTEAYAVFAQDSMRLRHDLTVNLGLRYERQSPPVDADDRASLYNPSTGSIARVGESGLPRAGYAADTNNLAPRIGAVWTLPSAAPTVLRAGYGRYHSRAALAPSEGLYFNAPYYDANIYVPLPGLPLTLDAPFPSFFPFAFPESALTIDPDFRTPSWDQFNVTLQRELWPGAAAEVGYVGSRGRNLVRARDLNQAPASPSPINLRPDPRFADIVVLESTARSRYDSLRLQLQQRGSGFSVLASYVYGKARDDASGFFSSAGDPNFPQDSRRPEAEWGPSAFDIRHRFTAGLVYDLPFGRAAQGVRRALLDAWQVAGVVTLQSGRPFTVALLPEIDNSNTGRAVLGFGNNDRPNVVGSPTLANPTPDRWFDTGAFTMPPFGSFGSAGRNALTGPGYANVNLAVLKYVRLAGDARLQLRLEAFNLFNRANYDLPDAFFGSPTFGRVLSAQAPRRLQFGARLTF